MYYISTKTFKIEKLKESVDYLDLIETDSGLYFNDGRAIVAKETDKIINVSNFIQGNKIKFYINIGFKILNKDYNKVEKKLKKENINFFSEYIPYYNDFIIIVPYIEKNINEFILSDYFKILEKTQDLISNYIDKATKCYLKITKNRIDKKILKKFLLFS
jgi:hypothetical protein